MPSNPRHLYNKMYNHDSGLVSEWLCGGLQIRPRGFDSLPDLHIPYARRMDIVTVTCSKDISAVRLQAHSMARFMRSRCRHLIIIEDTAMDEAAWRADIISNHGDNDIVVIDGDDLLRRTLGDIDASGWVRQQLMKLLAARLVQSDRYLILDSKNFLIKPLDMRSYPIVHGNNLYRSDRHTAWSAEYETFLRQAEILSGITRPKELTPNITPWTMITDVARQACALDIRALFLSVSLPCEFILYSLLAEDAGHSLTVPGPMVCHSIWHEDLIPSLDELVDIYAKPGVYMLGVHRTLVGKQAILPLVQWLATLGLDSNIITASLYPIHLGA